MHDWTDPELLFQPDALDTSGPIGMYSLPVLGLDRGAGFVGLLWVFHNSSSERVTSLDQFFGTMDAEVVFSYDGMPSLSPAWRTSWISTNGPMIRSVPF